MVLRRGTSCYWHWCPACSIEHPLPDDGWTFNGDMDKPTFTPSFKHTFVGRVAHGIYEPDKEFDDAVVMTKLVCHYIITDGRIFFCPDSWHRRIDIVPMLPFPDINFVKETQD